MVSFFSGTRLVLLNKQNYPFERGKDLLNVFYS